MSIENLNGAELRFYNDPRDLDGEERYPVTCIISLQRQFEKDTKPYYDRLTAIRSHRTVVPFYVMLPDAELVAKNRAKVN